MNKKGDNVSYTKLENENWSSGWKLRNQRPNLEKLCNICGFEFKPRSRYERYCENCKNESELYRYADCSSF